MPRTDPGVENLDLNARVNPFTAWAGLHPNAPTPLEAAILDAHHDGVVLFVEDKQLKADPVKRLSKDTTTALRHNKQAILDLMTWPGDPFFPLGSSNQPSRATTDSSPIAQLPTDLEALFALSESDLYALLVRCHLAVKAWEDPPAEKCDPERRPSNLPRFRAEITRAVSRMYVVEAAYRFSIDCKDLQGES